MMELDDDMIIIVVADDYENGVDSLFPPVEIKEEILDETDGILTTIDPTAGTVIIKEEIVDETVDHLSEQKLFADIVPKEEVLDEEEIFDEVKDEDYVPSDHEDGKTRRNMLVPDQWKSDEDYVPLNHEDGKTRHKMLASNQWKSDEDFVPSDHEDGKTRRKMLAPDQWKSFVNDLRNQYPELAKDKQLLVYSVAEIMRNVKPPTPPKDHYIVKDNILLFECVICGGVSDTIPAAGRHYQEKHGPRYLICFACGVDFRSTTNLYKHEKRCNSPDAEIVLRARAIAIGNKAKHRPYLQAKKIRPRETKSADGMPNHKNRNYTCTLCPAVFISKNALESHMCHHNGLRPFRCDQCPTAYASRSALSRHMKKHSGIKYICDHCNRPFALKTALVSHLDTHLPYRKHCCDYCGRRYAYKAALVIHIEAKHLNLPPRCACQLCPKRFRKMANLKIHMLKEHGFELMTRKMFFKRLPTMSETQAQQAKIVLKTDKPYFRNEDSQVMQPPRKTESEDFNAQFLSYIEANCPVDSSPKGTRNNNSVTQKVRKVRVVKAPDS